MKEGKLVPTDVTVRLLREAMQKSSNEKFLIDGFPRAIDQAETFEKDVKPPELVLFFDCPEVRTSLKFLATVRRALFIVIYHPEPLKRVSSHQSMSYPLTTQRCAGVPFSAVC